MQRQNKFMQIKNTKKLKKCFLTKLRYLLISYAIQKIYNKYFPAHSNLEKRLAFQHKPNL